MRYNDQLAIGQQNGKHPVHNSMPSPVPLKQHGGQEESYQDTVSHFVQTQRLNAFRDIIALRSFQPDEFGTTAASPSQAHIKAANVLLTQLQQNVLISYKHMKRKAHHTVFHQSQSNLEDLLRYKERIGYRTKQLEGIWQFYLELFNQRQSPFGTMLLAADRIALDCYQVMYTGVGKALSIPAPPPYSYMETGHTPATYRRGVILTRLGRNANPFPIVSLPYHRLNNPWTLGAIHHEVAHNLQSDLKLWDVIPKHIEHTLLKHGLSAKVARIWKRWHKEIWADLCGILLGGPGVVISLLDVLARTERTTSAFNDAGVHPTPVLRARINFHLLRRMGFNKEASRLETLWRRLYPHQGHGNIPEAMLSSFDRAMEHIVTVIVYKRYPQLGHKSLSEVVPFRSIYMPMIKEAAYRLAQSNDPGIIPARFMVAAARHALEQGFARPDHIRQNFYRALGSR